MFDNSTHLFSFVLITEIAIAKINSSTFAKRKKNSPDVLEERVDTMTTPTADPVPGRPALPAPGREWEPLAAALHEIRNVVIEGERLVGRA